jgi:hypothetical protein
VRPKKERLANSTHGIHVTRISKKGHAFLLPTKLGALDTLLANIDKASRCDREKGMTKREERGMSVTGGIYGVETMLTTAKNSGLFTYSSSMLVNKHTRSNIYVPTEDSVEKPAETKD